MFLPFKEDRNIFSSKLLICFPREMSTNDAIFALLSTVYQDLEKWMTSLLCASSTIGHWSFALVFYLLNHNIPLNKLGKLGIKGKNLSFRFILI